MNTNAARRLARNLMIRHGLALWNLEFMNHDGIAGQTKFSTHTISLAVEFTQAYDESQLTQLVLHEVAHALCGPSPKAHDEKWLKKARKIGYLHGETMPAEFPSPNIHWELTCTKTGEIHQTKVRPEQDATCKLCNDCTPLVERRQIVRSDIHNAPAPEHIAAPLFRRLKSLLRR